MSVLNENQARRVMAPDYFHIGLAATAAVVAHFCLLLLPELSLGRLLSGSKSVAVQVRLINEEFSDTFDERQERAPVQPDQNPSTQKLNPETNNTATNKQPQAILASQDNAPAIETIRITATMFKQWFETHEPQTNTTTIAQQIEAFEHSFVAPVSLPQEKIASYQSQYGELHVATKIGDKEVCYVQDQPMINDEWSTNIVMFYQCDTNPEFTLELR